MKSWLVFLTVLLFVPVSAQAAGTIELHVIDVGQGDGLLLNARMAAWAQSLILPTAERVTVD